MNSQYICNTGTQAGNGYCSSGIASLDSVDSLLQNQNDLKNCNQDHGQHQPETNEPQMNPFIFQNQRYSSQQFKDNFPSAKYNNFKENQPIPNHQHQQCNKQEKETNYDVNTVVVGTSNYYNNHPEIQTGGGVKYCFQPEALKAHNLQDLFVPFQFIQDEGRVKTTSKLEYKDKNPIPLRKKTSTPATSTSSNYYHHKSPFCSTIASKSEIHGFGPPPQKRGAKNKDSKKAKVFLVRDYSLKVRNEPQVKFVSYSEELLEKKLQEFTFERNYGYGYVTPSSITSNNSEISNISTPTTTSSSASSSSSG